MNRKERRAAAKARGGDGRRAAPADATLKAAIAHHQAGRLAEAKRLYTEVLSREPNQVVALHLVGVIAYQEGDACQATALIGKAIALRPDYADAHGNLGNALVQLGKLEDAVAAYRKALELKPDHADAHNNLGNVLRSQDKLEDAAVAYRNALELKPDHADAHNNLGIVLKEQGELEDAVAAYRKALALKPDYAEAHNNLGNALKDGGQLEEAVAAYRKALALKPDYAEAHNNLGTVLKEQGKLEDAVVAYHTALELKSDYAEAYNNLGNALKDLGRLEEAVATYHRALALKPDYISAHYNLGNLQRDLGRLEDASIAYHAALELKPDYVAAHNNLGNVLRDQGKLDDALAAYHRALALRPDYVAAHVNLGNALKDLGRLEEAAAAYHKALAVKPDQAEALSNLGNAYKNQGKLTEAVAAYRKALELKPDYVDAHSNLVFSMNYDERFTQQDIVAESRRWDAVHAVPRFPDGRPHPNDPDPDRRLRVGYVSPDFREHSVSYFLDPVIARHDRGSFEVFCYADVVKPDDKTARFRDLSDGWCSTVGMTDAAVAERIREDGIDILVDLAGHTANNRLLVFAERPAPLRVNWLGYPNTTGLSAMDYRLTDAIADPAGGAEASHSETLVRLPNGFLCFTPAADAPEIGEAHAPTAGHVTFGSFNNLAKVTPDVVATWARVLDGVPTSRLVIKSRPLADAETGKRYIEMFDAQGIDAERVELIPRIASRSGHLGAYGRVDIGLDPFPYNGTTTSCEALWMGVPVITLSGDRHAGRVGASILTRVGLGDLVAETKSAYVEKAVTLANDLDRLSAMRNGLRDRMRQSPLCDADGFARDIEAAYREMWRRFCA